MITPLYRVVLTSLSNGREYLDPAFATDHVMHQLRRENLIDRLIAEIDELLATSTDDASAGRAMAGYLTNIEYVDGPPRSYRQFLLAMRGRAVHFGPDAASIPPEPRLRDGLIPARTSAFGDPELQDRATRLLLDRHADMLASLKDCRGGWPSLCLYADLADELGITGQVIFGPTGSGTSLAVQPGESVSVSSASLWAHWDRFERRVVAADCQPEMTFATATREHYPALCQFFARFSDDISFLTSDVLDTMVTLKNPAFVNVRTELDRLLETTDDEGLRYVVEQCGSRRLPEQIREWVTLLRWRFDAFDWDPDRKGRFA